MSAKELATLLNSAHNVLVFTGAGMSTGSGIPDFRGAKGLWHRIRPVYFDEFMNSHEARLRHWQYKLDGWRDFRDARPSAAHEALYELDRMGRLDGLVTQNIDGLHQLAGHPEEKVIELHGTNRKVECVACQEIFEPDPLFEQFGETGEPPLCRCGGFLKPATISFGQAMPRANSRLPSAGPVVPIWWFPWGQPLRWNQPRRCPARPKTTVPPTWSSIRDPPLMINWPIFASRMM